MVAWSCIAVAFYFSWLAGAEPSEASRSSEAAWFAANYLLWIPLSLVVVALSNRFPLSEKEAATNLPIHLGFAVLLAMGHVVVLLSTYHWLDPEFRAR